MSHTPGSLCVTAALLSAACGSVERDPPPAPVAPGGSAGVASTSGGQGGEGGSNESSAGSAGSAGSTAQGGAAADCEPITPVSPRISCGAEPEQPLGEFVAHTIATCGTKADNSTGKPGPWFYEREYFVRLPSDYDPIHPYPLVLQAPGCGLGSDGDDVYPLPDLGDQVIRVALTPPPDAIRHPIAPGRGCFDDREGDDSVDWPFYEAVMNALHERFCIDETLVFASGYSSGALFANELGCKYAGHLRYPVRAIAVNKGELPIAYTEQPTCSLAPLPGMWVHSIAEGTTIPFDGAKAAINRAMVVNNCATDYDAATFEDYPIGGGNPDDTCKKVLGCPDAYPIVVCALPYNDNDSSSDGIVNPGFSVFFQSFFAP